MSTPPSQSSPPSQAPDAAAREAILQAGRAAFPELALDARLIGAHLQRLGGAGADIPEAHRADLALAAACVAGVPGADRRLEARHLREVGDFVARIDASPAFAAEVTQRVREKLLMGPEGGPGKLAEYAARGPLGGWIRVVSVRLALDLRRARQPDAPGRTDGSVADQVAAAVLSPELALLKESHKGACQEALNAAVARLSPRDRNILRLHYADGWSLQRLAISYKVNRATIARWIAGARQDLLDHMATCLGLGLGLGKDEVGSLVGLLRSQLDLSLTKF